MSEVKKVVITDYSNGKKVTVFYHEEMVETHYGPELKVEFWTNKEENHHISQEAMGASGQSVNYMEIVDYIDWGFE